MSWRGLVALVALLAAGIVGGFATAELLRSSPATTGAPKPVVAADPSIPVNPPAPLRDDPPHAPMGTDLPLRDVSVGTDNYNFVFKAPRGWSRLETSSNEVKYKKAGNPTNTYVLRVEQVISQHETIPDIVAARIEDLKSDQEDYQEMVRAYDKLEFSYVHDGYRRFGIILWMDINKTDQAEVEVALTGREVDLPGMQELMLKIIDRLRRN